MLVGSARCAHVQRANEHGPRLRASEACSRGFMDNAGRYVRVPARLRLARAPAERSLSLGLRRLQEPGPAISRQCHRLCNRRSVRATSTCLSCGVCKSRIRLFPGSVAGFVIGEAFAQRQLAYLAGSGVGQFVYYGYVLRNPPLGHAPFEKREQFVAVDLATGLRDDYQQRALSPLVVTYADYRSLSYCRVPHRSVL